MTDGAGSEAMRRAFEVDDGLEDALAGVSFHGRTDRWIVNQVSIRTGVDAENLWERYRTTYPTLLREELASRTPCALPGVPDLLNTLNSRHDNSYCLATGNQREASFIKLASVDLDRYFDGGGFGDRHEHRSDMLREAMSVLGWRRGERLVVIGDSEHDVVAAREVDAVSIAVATGNWSETDLMSVGADVVLPNLENLDRTLEALLCL